MSRPPCRWIGACAPRLCDDIDRCTPDGLDCSSTGERHRRARGRRRVEPPTWAGRCVCRADRRGRLNAHRVSRRLVRKRRRCAHIAGSTRGMPCGRPAPESAIRSRYPPRRCRRPDRSLCGLPQNHPNGRTSDSRHERAHSGNYGRPRSAALVHSFAARGGSPGTAARRTHSGLGQVVAAFQAARRRTSQTVTAMSSTDRARSQPSSIHWNGQNRLAGW
jgi:hypothetical protein